MRGKPLKKKVCTKKCEVGCASNYDNHIPHEHLIVATSTLVIVLSFIIATIAPTSAAPRPVIRKPIIEVSCRDTDGGKVSEQKGSTMLIELNKTHKTVKRRTIKTDVCYSKRLVQEYSCGKTNKTILTTRIYCKKNESCSQGACVPIATNSFTPIFNATSSALTATTIPPPTNPLTGPTGYCVLAGISGSADFTHLQSPDVGSGYAQVKKTSSADFAKIVAACAPLDFRVLESQYCAIPNQPSYQKNAVIYDAQGNFLQFGGCQSFHGCDYQSCPYSTMTPPASTTTTPTGNSTTITCSDSDGGNNPDVRGIATLGNSFTNTNYQTDYCVNSEYLSEFSCATTGNDFYIASSTVQCDSGICSNGACITETSD